MNEEFATRIGLLFADLAVKSMLVLGTAWIASFFLRKRSAATRHMVWLIAFSALIFMPVLMAILPSHPVGIIQSQDPAAQAVTPSVKHEISKFDLQALEDSIVEPYDSSLTQPEPVAPVSPAPSRWKPQKTVLIVGILWVAGCIWIVLQSAIALRAIRRMRKLSSLATGELQAKINFTGLSQRVGISRSWELRTSAGSKPPTAMTWGFMKPIVLLPKESSSWSSERLEAVLLHELAHVRRYDSVSQFIAVVTCALYWFNPVVWLCARAMRAEAETAADDTVLRHGVKPSVYAGELIRIAAELGHRRQPFSPIGVPVMKQSKIESRVQAILDPSPRLRRGVTLIEALAIIAVAAGIVIPVSSVRATIAPPIHTNLASLESVVRSSSITVPSPPMGVVQVDQTAVSHHADVVNVPKSSVACRTPAAAHKAQAQKNDSDMEKAKLEKLERDQAQLDKANAELLARQAKLQASQNKLTKSQTQAKLSQRLAEMAKRDAEIVQLKAERLERLAKDSRWAEGKSAAERQKLEAEAEAMRLHSDSLQNLLAKNQAENAQHASDREKALAGLQERLSHSERLQAEKQEMMLQSQQQQAKMADEILARDLASQKEAAEARMKYQAVVDRLLKAAFSQKSVDLREQKIAKEQLHRLLESYRADQKRSAYSKNILNSWKSKFNQDAELKRAKLLMEQSVRSQADAQRLFGQHSLSSGEYAKAKEALRIAQIQLEVARKLLEVKKNKQP